VQEGLFVERLLALWWPRGQEDMPPAGSVAVWPGGH
jgi:hypothetical protein